MGHDTKPEHHCPHCREPLLPVAFLADVFGCAQCKETWYLSTAPRGWAFAETSTPQ